MRIEDLYVKPGDPITAKLWNALLDWDKESSVMAGPNVRLQRMQRGICVVAEAPSSNWNHPWRCSLTGFEVKLTAGTVNTLVPRINGVRIDGRDERGKTVTVPPLKIVSGPGVDLESWVCVQVKVTASSSAMDEKDKDALTIVHVPDLDPRMIEGGSPDKSGLGLHPLAQILWKDKATPERLFQITHSNLTHRFITARDGQPSRHFFFA
jgi:hypothetical protein